MGFFENRPKETQFGMPSLLECNDLRESVALCRKLGLQFVELNMNFPQYQLEKLDANELKSLSEEYGIFYTLHFDDNMNVADFNPYVADAYRRTVTETVELAKKVGIPVLNMHLLSGARYTMPDRKVYFFEAYRDEYLKRIEAFRDACCEAAGDSDILICVENTSGFHAFQKNALDILLERPMFALTLDTGHNHCAEYHDEPWMFERKNRICHMHLHDSKSGWRDHLGLGAGDVNIEKYLDLAEEAKCTVVLETKTLAGLGQSVDWIHNQKRYNKKDLN